MARYVFSDLHGWFPLWEQIKKFVKPEDELYCLGDCGDRGPRSWETIKAILEDPQVTYIMGNHEHMLCGTMARYLKDPRVAQYCYCYDEPIYQLLTKNGGQYTYRAWVNEGADVKYLDALDALPRCVILTREDGSKVSLSHAGHAWYQDPYELDEFELLWDREHIRDTFDAPERENFYVIHGHTPCPYVYQGWKPSDGAIHYEAGHRIDIDMGTHTTHQVCLLNIDTFEEYIFKYEPEQQEE